MHGARRLINFTRDLNPNFTKSNTLMSGFGNRGKKPQQVNAEPSSPNPSTSGGGATKRMASVTTAAGFTQAAGRLLSGIGAGVGRTISNTFGSKSSAPSPVVAPQDIAMSEEDSDIGDHIVGTVIPPQEQPQAALQVPANEVDIDRMADVKPSKSISNLISIWTQVSKEIKVLEMSGAAEPDIELKVRELEQIEKVIKQTRTKPQRESRELDVLDMLQEDEEVIADMTATHELPLFYRQPKNPEDEGKYNKMKNYVLNQIKKATRGGSAVLKGKVKRLATALGFGGLIPIDIASKFKEEIKTQAAKLYSNPTKFNKDTTTEHIVEEYKYAAYRIMVIRANEGEQGLGDLTRYSHTAAESADPTLINSDQRFKVPLTPEMISKAHQKPYEAVELKPIDPDNSIPNAGSKNPSMDPPDYSETMSVIDDVKLQAFFMVLSEKDAYVQPNIRTFLRKKKRTTGKYVDWPYGMKKKLIDVLPPTSDDPFRKRFFQRFEKLCKDFSDNAARRTLFDLFEEEQQMLSAANAPIMKLFSEQQRRDTRDLLMIAKQYISSAFSAADREALLSERYFLSKNMTDTAKRALMNSIIKGSSDCPIMVPLMQTVLDLIDVMIPGSSVENFLTIIKNSMTLSAMKSLRKSAKEKTNYGGGVLADAVSMAAAGKVLDDFGIDLSGGTIGAAASAAAAAEKVFEIEGYRLTIEAYSSLVEDCITGKKLVLYPLRYSAEFTYSVLFYVTQTLKKPYCYPFGRTHPPADWVYVNTLLVDPTNRLGLRLDSTTFLKKLGGVKLLDNHCMLSDTIESDFSANYESLLTRTDSTKSFTDCLARIATRLERIAVSTKYVCQSLNENDKLEEDLEDLIKKGNDIVRSANKPNSEVLPEMFANFRDAVEVMRSAGGKTDTILKHYKQARSADAVSLDDLLAPFDPEFTHFVVMVMRMFLASKNSESSEFVDWIHGKVLLSETQRSSKMAYLFRLLSEKDMRGVLLQIITDSQALDEMSQYLLKVRDSVRSPDNPAKTAVNLARSQYSKEYRDIVLAYDSASSDNTLATMIDKHRKGNIPLPDSLSKRKPVPMAASGDIKYYDKEDEIIQAVISNQPIPSEHIQALHQLMKPRPSISTAYQFAFATIALAHSLKILPKAIQEAVARRGKIDPLASTMRACEIAYGKIAQERVDEPEDVLLAKAALAALRDNYYKEKEAAKAASPVPASVSRQLDTSTGSINPKFPRKVKKRRAHIDDFDDS